MIAPVRGDASREGLGFKTVRDGAIIGATDMPMLDQTTTLLARERELEAIDESLDSLARGPRALVFEGEAGIGKTRVWEEALRRAREHGCRVLSCRPTESEAHFGYAALADLLTETLTETLGDLPQPQRRALEVALLLDGPKLDPVDQRAVAMAFLTSLRTLEQAQPLVVAVDDVQWLDSSSAVALEFALRRLRQERIGVFLTLRSADEGEAPLGLDRALDPSKLTRLRLPPLSLGALHRLLREALGATFARPVLQRLLEASGGNPFFALELGRALVRREGRLGDDGELPVPRRLDDLVYERVAVLPRDTRELLDLAALLAEPSVSLLRRASDRELEPTLEPAHAAGVISFDGNRVRFTHPLLAAACLAHVDDARRRALHRRLAEVVESSEQRARHLALAAEEPSEELAALVEGAAIASLSRGARLAAAELLEHACRLTPQQETTSWTRRSALLADVLYQAGDPRLALLVAENVIDRGEAGPHRALALALSSFNIATRLARFDQALAEAGDDPALRARIAFMAAATRGHSGDFRGRAAGTQNALESARRAGEPHLLVQTLTSAAFGLMLLEPNASVVTRAHEYLHEAIAIEASLPPDYTPAFVFWTPKTALAFEATGGEALVRARELWADQAVRAAGCGDDTSLIGILALWSNVEWRAGAFARALDLASEACEVAERSGDLEGRGESLIHLALVQAVVGSLDDARSTLALGAAAAAAVGDQVYMLSAKAAAALIESCADEPAKVLHEAGTLAEEREALGSGDPAERSWLAAGDEIEARIALGLLEDAREQIDQLEERSRRLRRPRSLGIALRGRGLLRAAEDGLPGALEAFDASLDELSSIQAPFEVARTLLARGIVQRRGKQRRAGRDSLTAAAAKFDELGAAPWAERARAELARVGGRPPSAAGLTPTERRVAALVAEGRSNREVAAALFVTPRTVEWNLTKIYAKLGVRSRTELAHLRARGDEPRAPQ